MSALPTPDVPVAAPSDPAVVATTAEAPTTAPTAAAPPQQTTPRSPRPPLVPAKSPKQQEASGGGAFPPMSNSTASLFAAAADNSRAMLPRRESDASTQRRFHPPSQIMKDLSSSSGAAAASASGAAAPTADGQPPPPQFQQRIRGDSAASNATNTGADDDDLDDNPYYQIDRQDPLIDERAEFLGMDVQDFRELLVLAARRTRDVLAVESGEAADHLLMPHLHHSHGAVGSPHNSETASRTGLLLPSTHSFLHGENAGAIVGASQAYFALTNSTSRGATGTRSDLPSNASAAPSAVGGNVNDPQSSEYGANYYHPHSGGGGGSYHNPSQNISSTRASTVGMSVGGGGDDEDDVRVGPLPRFARTRESVASLVRMLGDGLFGRRVMWADQGGGDDDEVIGEYDDDDDGADDGDATETGSSINSEYAGRNSSALSNASNTSARRKRKQQQQQRKVKKAAKQPLVRVHTYDLHGTMIMGVERVGQWRGWLWLAAYFAYHILIEYSAVIVSINDEEHGRQVLRARAYGAVIAMLIALVYVAIARCVKSRPPSRSRTAWSMGANGMILMGACGMLFGAFEAFFWGSLHSKYKNGALVVYPTIFLGPVITVLLRRPFFPARYHQNVSQIPDKVRLAGSGGGTGEGKVVYLTEALSCGIVLLGSLVMCFSFPGNITDWADYMILQLFACITASIATVCLAVLSQRGLLRYSIIAITACRAFGFFALMLTNEIGLHQDSSSFLTKVAPVLWLALLMGIDYIMFLAATMRSNQHLDIMAVVVLMSLSYIEVPVLSVLLSPNDYVGELGVIDPQWVLWLGIALVVLGCVGLGVFATLRQQFVMYEMWQKGELLLKPKGMRGVLSGNNNNNSSSNINQSPTSPSAAASGAVLSSSSDGSR